MTLEKTKKRGRPAQLLQVAELHAFVEYLLEKDPRTDLLLVKSMGKEYLQIF